MNLQETNKQKVLELLDVLMNKKDYEAAKAFFIPDYVQHSAMIRSGRDGLIELIKSCPPELRYEHGIIVAEGDYVIVHGRYTNFDGPKAWIAADIFRLKDGLLIEHWDVLQHEASQAESKSGHPMFGDSFSQV